MTAPAQGRTDGRAVPAPVRVGLPDQIISELLRAVADGSYPPGSRLPPEAELAARARVSRLTLREAVKVLRDKGVLRVEQGRGTFVNPPAAWSALDADLLASRTALSGGLLAPQILEARRVVEVGVAGLAAARRTEDDLASMRAVVDTMRTAHADGDVEAFSVADSAFHETVLHAAGNPFLTALYEPIRTLVHQVRVSTSHLPLSRELAIAAHTRILVAVEDRDEDAARRAVSDHLDETHRTALDLGSAVLDQAGGARVDGQ